MPVSVGSGREEDEVVKEGGVIEERDAEEPVFPAVDEVWLAVLELPEPEDRVNVTVGAVNREGGTGLLMVALQTDEPGLEMVNAHFSTILRVLLT